MIAMNLIILPIVLIGVILICVGVGKLISKGAEKIDQKLDEKIEEKKQEKS